MLHDEAYLADLVDKYHELGSEIADHESRIASLRRHQAALIKEMSESGMTFRAMSVVLGISKSRAHQLADEPVATMTRQAGT